MIATAFHPTVAIQSFFGDKHAVGKLQELSHCFCQIFIFLLLVIITHLCYCRNTHKHIIQPKSVMLRTVACKSSICQTILFIYDEIKIITYQFIHRKRGIFQTDFHHRCAYGSRIIQCVRSEDLKQLRVRCPLFFINTLEMRCYFGQKTKTILYIIHIAYVARSFGCRYQGRVGHSPFITCQTESSTLQLCLLSHRCIVGNHFTRILVYHTGGSLLIYISKYTVYLFLYLFRCQITIRALISRLQ